MEQPTPPQEIDAPRHRPRWRVAVAIGAVGLTAGLGGCYAFVHEAQDGLRKFENIDPSKVWEHATSTTTEP